VKTPDAVPDVVEVEAILWSYAACLHLELDPVIVFHPDGYRGQAESLLRTFQMGVYPGLSGLVAAGMTLLPVDAERFGEAPFPTMQKWLRD
jgi:hypothetical protein